MSAHFVQFQPHKIGGGADLSRVWIEVHSIVRIVEGDDGWCTIHGINYTTTVEGSAQQAIERMKQQKMPGPCEGPG